MFDRSAPHPVALVITKDGKPIPESMRGKDISVDALGRTVVLIDESRMYYLITTEDPGLHEVRLFPTASGARVCSFTFGNRCEGEFDRL